MCARNDKHSRITVVSDDTDIFVFLVYYDYSTNLKNHVIMEPTSKDRTIVDIGSTVEKHSCIIAEILPVHAPTGCDTVACYFGIGKLAKGLLLKCYELALIP